MEKGSRARQSQASKRSSKYRIKAKPARINQRPAVKRPKPRYGASPEFDGLFNVPPEPAYDREQANLSAWNAISTGWSFFNGIGGLDGIMAWMTKVQKFYKLCQQMGPMFKLIGLIGGPKAQTASLRALPAAARTTAGKKKTIKKRGS
ncbi:hypothetical protein CBW46_006740 [Paenibacillus xerothermodurans]|uniref:Uncharacterized protein n=2 Tax=Paenibacillus xerothermodurans TaxID=1977292 RepID=A0A2W1NTW6_PAEXE|nr:hypothetical protein CBW46_006740 [Paenibacillus xerothermodurans]